MYSPRLFGSLLLLSGCLSLPAVTADFTLAHKNSSAQINITNGSVGVVNWSVDGVNQLGYQGFFYRIGNNPEALLSTISLTPTVSFVQVPNVLSKLDVTYANSLLSVQTVFQLTGSTAGSGKAGLSETITIKNISGTALDFHFFQYSDFDLSGTSAGQSVQFLFDSALQPYQVIQTGGGLLTETVNASAAPVGHYQAGNNLGIFASLTDLSPTTLTDVAGAGGGNANFAYQWDVVLDPNETLTISKLMNIVVPEPAVGSFLLAMAALWAGVRARRLSVNR